MISYLTIFVVASVIGVLSYTTITSFYAYQRALVRITQLESKLEKGYMLQYGTVESVDHDKLKLAARVTQPFGGTVLLELSVARDAYIARQELIPLEGEFVALSNEVPASFTDIRIGDRIAFGIVGTSADQQEIVMLLFGNPL